jgi:hypothetical protein
MLQQGCATWQFGEPFFDRLALSTMKHPPTITIFSSSIAFARPTKPSFIAAHYKQFALSGKAIMRSFSTNNDVTAAFAELDLSKIEKFAHQKGDALFGYIEECQVNASPTNNACFGNFLDAGTGSHSLRWIASIIHRERLLAKNASNGTSSTSTPLASLKSFTAITADETMRLRVSEEAKTLGIDSSNIIIGNWNEGVNWNNNSGNVEFTSSSRDTTTNDGNNKTALLEGQTFDTILADYLVGAIDGFSPYFQDQIFHRLVHHLAPGGRMYIIGLQPIPDRAPGDANIFCKITKVRDACILLANHRCYREYPLDWIERHVVRAGMEVVESRTYPIRYTHETMVRQINVGRSKLKLFPSTSMANEMGKVLDGLEKESLEVTKRQADGRITLGFDYVVVAEKSKSNHSSLPPTPSINNP